MLEGLPQRVTVYEVGPRDGLQNEARIVPTEDKVAFIDALSATGLRHIEITSFVNPKWIPQLSDAVDVARSIRRAEGVSYTALVPNRKGMDRALEGGMQEVAVFCSASETHNRKNINKSIAEALDAFEDVFEPARTHGIRVRAYVSTVFGCPYEGDVDPAQVVWLTRELRDRGAYQISLGDTVGIGNPAQVDRVLDHVLSEVDAGLVALHMHDTRGTALANVLVGLARGITTVDAAIGGLGGCPYAPGASGNLATEDLVAMLHAMGVETGIDLDKLVQCSRQIGALVGHDLPSKYLKAHVGASSRPTGAQQRKE